MSARKVIVLNLTMGEKIRIILKRRGMTVAQLADLTNQTRQNLSNKLTRDNFQEQDIKAMAEALNCDYEAYLVMKDTGEKV
ncbi:MAG: helix-turn-helix transcriptional regulator [Clostridia bacterium]|nr:helix-turn-helix transcriptional regulator [Clostridia bacterium]